MSLSPAEVAAKDARIARDREKLDRALADPNLMDARHVYEQYGGIGNLNTTSTSVGAGAADVQAGIDGSTDIEAIKSLILDIKNELINTTAIADLLIQDSGTTTRYFVRQDKIDQTTGLPGVTIVNLDGTAPAPAPVLPLSPIKAGSSNLINEDLFVAQVVGTGYAIGDSIANVRLLDGETGLVVVSSWYNITTRSSIVSAPPIGHLKGYEDKLEELLAAILAIDTSSSTSLANLETELGNNGDTTIPATNLDPATLKGLIRRSNDLIEASSSIDAIGSTVDLSIPSSPTQPATLKGLDRGIWQTLLDAIVSIGAASDTTIPATINDSSPIKGLLRFFNNSVLSRLLQGSQPQSSALATTRARKTTAVGWTSTGVLNLNILDATGAGLATDVRDYNSMQIVITTVAAAIKVLLQVATDSGFTVGVSTMEWQAWPAGSITTGQVNLAANSIFRFNVDLTNANYIKIANNYVGTPAFGLGATVNYTLSQTPIPSKFSLTAGNSVAVTSVSTIPVAVLSSNTSIVDVASAVIAASATTAAITPSGGVSYQVEFDVTAIAGADTVCILSIEESYNSGTNWRKIYTFEPITTAKGNRVYKSDLLPLTGNRIRYVQTITGATPSITRQILRTQSNLSVPTAIGTNRLNLFNALNAGIESPVHGRVRRMTVNNRTAELLFLQIHDKATALVAGDIPVEIFQLPATSTLPFTVADLGEHGTILGAAINPRIAVSTTFNTHTAPNAIGANQLHYFAEIL